MDTPFNEEELLNFSKKHSSSFHVLANRRESAVLHLDKGVFRLSRSQKLLNANAKALKLLGNLSLAPKLIKIKDSYSIEEFIEGKEFILNDAHLNELFARISLVHAIKGDPQNWKEHLKNRYQERFDHVDQKYVNFFFKHLQPITEGSLLHGMFEINNVIWSDKPYFVDFCDSCFGEKEFDIGALYYKEFFSVDTLKKLCNKFGYDFNKALLYALYFGIKTVGKIKSDYKEMKLETIYRLLQ